VHRYTYHQGGDAGVTDGDSGAGGGGSRAHGPSAGASSCPWDSMGRPRELDSSGDNGWA
jgi:hypothetical protein